MRKFVVGGLIGLLVVSGLIAQVITANVDKATLSARVAFLEKYIKAPETVDEGEAQALLTRLNQLGTRGSASTPTVQALAAKLAELESQVPGGVVSAESAVSKMGQRTHVYGSIEKVYQGTDKNGRPYVNITLRGGFGVVWFSANTAAPLYNAKIGQAMVVSGQVAEYNGNPQIVVSGPEDVTLP